MSYLDNLLSFITPQAKAMLTKKMQALKVRLKELSVEKAEAAGDDGGLTNWHDNFAFDEANRQCQLVESQIAEIQKILQESQESAAKEQDEVVAIGTTVNYSKDQVEQPLLTIGSIGESFPEKGLISYQAPLSALLLGLRPHQSRKGKLADKIVELTVNDIFPPSYRYEKIHAELE